MFRSAGRHRTSAPRVLGLGLLASFASASAFAQAPPSWASAGGDSANSHAVLSVQGNITSATQINPATAGKLAVKWTFTPSGDISATPTVEAGGLYVPDWAGMLYKVNPKTGAQIWSHAVCDYTSSCNTSNASISRTSPAIGSSVIVIGDAMAHYNRSNYGAVVVGVNKTTGAKAWTTIVNNSSPYASVLGSPVIYNNVAYVGTASWEEGVAGSNPSYQPVFRGNVTALNINTGAIIWQFTTVPAGYAGGPVPGSGMSVWPVKNALLVATGNNYAVPSAVSTCVGKAGSSLPAQRACMDPTNYVDSMLSLDLTTGQPKWTRLMAGADNWTEACYYGNAACPKPTGTDSDFAQAPLVAWLLNFTNVSDDRGGTSQSYLMGAGRKSSQWYAVNPANGGLFWTTYVGTGGMEWGSALNTDDHNLVYFALHNPGHVSQTIIGQSGTNPTTWNAGAWGALDIRTGAKKWMVPTVGKDLQNTSQGAIAPGCLSFTNRVLFAGASSGYFVALDANTGRVYWTYPTGGTVVSCPAIYDETVYWGTGYARNGVGKHALYAFSVSGS